jgi:hypothetical protein
MEFPDGLHGYCWRRQELKNMMLYWKADVDAYGRVEKGNTGRRLKKKQETSNSPDEMAVA